MAHEDLNREQVVEGSSNRSFGVVFTVVFLIIAAWPLLSGGGLRWWSVAVAAVFAALALLWPALLAAPNRWWMKFGLLLGRIVSPIALGLLFYGTITPIGLVMRLFGKDPLLLKRDAQAASYWRRREPPGPKPDSLNQQF